MSFPTVLGPWYVVQRIVGGDRILDYEVMEYYTSMEEQPGAFQPDKKRAMLFMSLASAARVAASEGAEVRVLTTRDEAKEFDR